MALDRRDLNEMPRAPWAVPLVVSALAIAAGAWRLHAVNSPVVDIGEPSPAESASAAAGHSALPPRCVEVSGEAFVVGEPPPPPPRPAAGVGTGSGGPGSSGQGALPSGPPDEPPGEVEDPGAPFAVEIGRGAVFDGGFAAGALRSGEGGAVAMVATVSADGRGGKLVKLGRSRGDLDPPVVTGAGASVLAVLIEPNAGGRALKVAKVTGAEVTWGPELEEGHDDSLALDIAATGSRALVVWDDLSGTGEAARSSVMLASFDVATMRAVAPARPISAKSTEATAPRLAARPGGYWLAYLAHGAEDAKKKKKRAPDDGDESEDQGEAITTSWIEILPLDDGGTPSGAARAITPKGGHVLSFDLAPGENGNALVAFRDDDTPTGSSGGTVSATLVRLGGGGEPHLLVESAGGAGTPNLLPGWISLASVSGPTRLAALTPAGELLDALAPEPSLGAGEPIAATVDSILWARPLGKAIRLSVVRCEKRAAGDAGAATADPSSADPSSPAR